MLKCRTAGRAARRVEPRLAARRRRSGRLWAGRASRPTCQSRSRKTFPLRRGLGGGSADAAAALRALARVWGGVPLRGPPRCRRWRLVRTSRISSSGGTALGLGRGEEIYPLVDLPTHWVVIVQPPYGISTAEAYAWYDEDRTAGWREPREPQMLPVPWPTRAAQMINDLEPPVVRRHPEIGTLKSALARGGSGRGSHVRAAGRPSSACFARRRLPCARSKPVTARRRARSADAHLEPRRTRAPGPSGCH